jgi:hypothetical protein
MPKEIFKIKIDNKPRADEILEQNGFRAKWEGNNLIVAGKNYDRIEDILSDNDINFTSVFN